MKWLRESCQELIRRMLRRKGTVFYRFFIVLLLSISVPLLVISMIAVHYSSAHIIKQANHFNMDMLSQRHKIIEQKLQSYSNLSFHILDHPDIWTLVMSNQDVSSEYFMMRGAIESMTSSAANQESIHSIYLFNNQDDFVLSDTRYSKTDFPDPAVLQPQMRGNFEVVAPHRLSGGQMVVSYIREFTGTVTHRSSYLVMNIYADFFFDDLYLNDGDQRQMYIFDRNNHVFFNSHPMEGTLNQEEVLGIVSHPGSSYEMQLNGVLKYVFKIDIPEIGWTFVAMQDYASLVQPADLIRNIIFYSFSIVLLVALGLAYVNLSYLYKPLMQLMRKIRKMTQLQQGDSDNEYKVIDYTISSLFTKHDELNTKYDLIYPYFSRHFLGDIIDGRSFDSFNFKHMLSLLEVQFPHKGYMVLLFDFENSPFNLELKQHMDRMLEVHHSSMKYVLAKLSESRAMAVVNMDQSMRWAYEVVNEIKDQLNQIHIDVTIGMSGLTDHANDLPQSYQEALQLVQSKFFTGKNQIITDMDLQNTDKNLFYDRSLEKQMLECIKSRNKDKAVELLELIVSELLVEPGGINYTRSIFFQISTDILYALADLGFDVKEEFPDIKGLFAEIHNAETMEALKAYSIRLITLAIEILDQFKQEKNSRIVAQAIDFIKTNYTKDISLDHVAASVYLSAGYLSIVFKAETGMTILEYITDLRMQTSADLLCGDKVRKVQDVAGKVGYNNIQSFLRHFKKHFGMTPNQFRRSTSNLKKDRSVEL